MGKSELVHALSNKLPELEKSDVQLALNCLINQLTHALTQGERIEIRGFGNFQLRYQSPRIARNPSTGETVQVQAHHTIHFKPGKDMRDRVNTGRDHYRIMK